MAVRRSAFDVWPGFRESIGIGTPIHGGDEHYAFFELLRRGFRVVYAPEAVVAHPCLAPSMLAARYRQVFEQAGAFVTLILVEEPEYRRRTLKLLLHALKKKPHTSPMLTSAPSWRSVLPLRQVAMAAARGPVLYARSRIVRQPSTVK
jgi:hypothetical protein